MGFQTKYKVEFFLTTVNSVKVCFSEG